MSKSKIFPIEIVEFTVENYFAKQHSNSRLIYLMTFFSILSFLLLLPFVKIDITNQGRGIIRSGQESNSIVAGVYGEIAYSNLWENKMVHSGDTLLIIKTDRIDEEIAINQQKEEENESYINDLKILVSDFRIKPKTSFYLAEYLAFNQEYQVRELEFQQLNNEFETEKKLFEKKVIAPIEFEKKKNTYEMAENRLKLLVSQKISEWQARIVQYELQNSELSSLVIKLRKEKEQYVIKAPISGTINQYSGIKPGNFISPNQAVAQISPIEDLVVECLINPKDIGYIRDEMDVHFQFDAFNYNQWGMAQGKVAEIMEDIVQINNSPFFKVRCYLHTDYLQLKNGYKGKLKKGMTLTARFKIARRSLFDLLYDKADDWLNPKIMIPN
jgi:membrane fusion protein, peptide pheromone/bacteriocin exporter